MVLLMQLHFILYVLCCLIVVAGNVSEASLRFSFNLNVLSLEAIVSDITYCNCGSGKQDLSILIINI